MSSTNTPKQSAIRRGNQRVVKIGATASALAVVLTGAVAGPAMAVPGEVRRVHVEGQLIPMETSLEDYRVTGGLAGTYSLRSERVIYAWTYFGTQIQEIEGTASFKGCLDQNQNQNCDVDEPSGEPRLKFNRVASFNAETSGLIEAITSHQLSNGGPFSGGVLTTRDIPVHNSNQHVSTYQGDLEIIWPADSRRAD
jgi:hypothetical protein